MRRSMSIFVGILVTAALSLTGCGKGIQVGEVKGRVTVNGEPAQIDGLLITFLCSDGQVFASAVDSQGLFQSPKIPVGEVKIGFNIAGLAEPDPDQNMMAAWPENPAATVEEKRQSTMNQVKSQQQKEKSSPYDQKNLPLYKKYLDPLTSGQTTIIQAGKAIEFNPEILGP